MGVSGRGGAVYHAGMRPTTLVFDLNGTLLNLSVLDPHFKRIFGDAGSREKWFQQLQTLWMTSIACGTLVALTNNALKLAKTQVKFAGIADSFDRVFSVDEVQRYKPAREPYAMWRRKSGTSRSTC